LLTRDENQKGHSPTLLFFFLFSTKLTATNWSEEGYQETSKL
jgi:hypothetical protein